MFSEEKPEKSTKRVTQLVVVVAVFSPESIVKFVASILNDQSPLEKPLLVPRVAKLRFRSRYPLMEKLKSTEDALPPEPTKAKALPFVPVKLLIVPVQLLREMNPVP